MHFAHGKPSVSIPLETNSETASVHVGARPKSGLSQRDNVEMNGDHKFTKLTDSKSPLELIKDFLPPKTSGSTTRVCGKVSQAGGTPFGAAICSPRLVSSGGGLLQDEITRKGNASPGVMDSPESIEMATAIESSHRYMVCSVEKKKKKTSSSKDKAHKEQARMKTSKDSTEETSAVEGKPTETVEKETAKAPREETEAERSARRDSELLELVDFDEAPEDLEEIGRQAKEAEEKAKEAEKAAKEVKETPEQKELREKTIEVEALRLKMAELEDFKRNAELEEISRRMDELDSSEKRKAKPPAVKESKPVKEDSLPDDGKTVPAEGVSSAFNWMDNSDARFKRLEDTIVSLQRELALARRDKADGDLMSVSSTPQAPVIVVTQENTPTPQLKDTTTVV
ncbi:hypothetical protein ADUPG1_012338, partial [Aduncisulcus paluster]